MERDPFEGGERQLLNYGHTLGHALEAATGYGTMLHGDAVAWGMRFCHRLALSRGADRRVPRAGRAAPRPARVAGLRRRSSVSEVLANLARDKKARESGLVWILPMAPGRGERTTGIGEAEVPAEVEARSCEHCRTGAGPV